MDSVAKGKNPFAALDVFRTSVLQPVAYWLIYLDSQQEL
jgi:hypothetical protein